MLLNPFSAFFFSFSLFFSSDWLFLKISSSLLKLSLYLSILVPNSVNILITSALNFLSGKLFISVLFLVFFQVFSLALSIETDSSVFSFCVSISFSVEIR